jgi:hypothetical protein
MATVADDGTLTMRVPSDIPPGDHRVRLIFDEAPDAKQARTLTFSKYAVGLASPAMTFRREDLYDDQER